MLYKQLKLNNSFKNISTLINNLVFNALIKLYFNAIFSENELQFKSFWTSKDSFVSSQPLFVKIQEYKK